MDIKTIVFVIAAVCFGVDAWQNRSLVSDGFCLVTIGAFLI